MAAWRIPEDILAAAPESPYTFPVGLFRAAPEPADGPSRGRAVEALGAAGVVLDVGCGGGAASLALLTEQARPALLVGVDQSAAMLAEFERGGRERGVATRAIQGSWPAVAPAAGRADVVVCHHVLYNVADLTPFVQALTAAAWVRVVCEVTAVHPWADLGPLWTHFHGQPRPAGPSAALLADALAELGLQVHREQLRQAGRRPADRAVTVAFTRRRLCLPADRDPEVDRLLPVDFGAEREVVTLWWDVPAASPS